ncbi:unnamed protein product [Tilletia controversa]|uniref:Uncharacterized protein n=2 Tax=Tilletia TaxID=13289 RepID=A0A177V8R6_9BASI|nr:hypothetical protein CF336_g1680 [Tilletia laevis]KAE8264061.1 hypothetical protein A4X03_0g1222 [Tilletia caries]CAD6915627.1 unnamed protein product [Tilletia controversa]KAE8203259.1 hypothetical protein CF335_g3098 [Tilletia laevis]CAD6890806.1 unnamed protein product [Tilletia caries]
MSSSNDSSAGPAPETASAERKTTAELTVPAHDQGPTFAFRPLADIMPLARAAEEQEEESQDESEQAAAERVEEEALKARRKQRKMDKRRRGGDEDGKSAAAQAKKKRRIDVESASDEDQDEVDIMALAEEAALAVEDAKKALARAGALADTLTAAHSAMEASRREVKTRSTVERWREKVSVPR